MWGRNGRWILPEMPDFHVAFRNLLHAVNLRHGTDGFTSPPKEGVLRIFSHWKIRRLRPGLNPRTWVPKAERSVECWRIFRSERECFRSVKAAYKCSVFCRKWSTICLISVRNSQWIFQILQRKEVVLLTMIAENTPSLTYAKYSHETNRCIKLSGIDKCYWRQNGDKISPLPQILQILWT